MILWRISEFATLSGEGGILFGARWHTKGSPIIYCAESPAGALLERIAHVDKDDLPDSYQLLEIEIPDVETALSTLEKEFINVQNKHFPEVAETQNIGNEWLKSQGSLCLRVPSVLVPKTYNVLMNPLHKLMIDVKIISITRYPFDNRLN